MSAAEVKPQVPEGAQMDFDPLRRKSLATIVGAGAAAGGAYVAAKTGLWSSIYRSLFSGGSTASAPRTAGQLPADLYAALTASGQAIQVPSISADPAGASPGALWYRDDLGELSVMDGISGQVTRLGTASSGALPGLLYVTNGTALTTAFLNSTIAAGYVGWYLDPRYVYNAAGLVIANPSIPFVIQSTMLGAVGFNINGDLTLAEQIIIPSGYVYTGTSSQADGIQVYGGNPTPKALAVKIQGVVFVGSNSNSVLHLGGLGRGFKLEDVTCYNSNTTEGYGFIDDTALGDNCEDIECTHCVFAGYNGLGIGIDDLSGSPNDSHWTEVTTGGINFGINYQDGGNHLFENWYDRTNASISLNTGNTAGMITLIGGETHNPGNTLYSIDTTDADGGLTIYARQDTNGNATFTSGNIFLMSGKGSQGTYTVSGAKVYIAAGYGGHDPTWAGTSGTISYYGNTGFSSGSWEPPNLSGFTGTIINLSEPTSIIPNTVASLRQNQAATTATLTYTPPSAISYFSVNIWVHITSYASTSIVPNITWTDDEGGSQNQTIPVVEWGSGSPAFLTSITANGVYSGFMTFATNVSGSTVTITIDPNGSSLACNISIIQLM